MKSNNNLAKNLSLGTFKAAELSYENEFLSPK